MSNIGFYLYLKIFFLKLSIHQNRYLILIPLILKSFTFESVILKKKKELQRYPNLFLKDIINIQTYNYTPSEYIFTFSNQISLTPIKNNRPKTKKNKN